MPNKRADGQELVALALKAELLEATDAARKLSGQDRSTFIRVALVSDLNQRHGCELDPSVAFAPDRARKRRPSKLQTPQSNSKTTVVDQSVEAGANELARGKNKEAGDATSHKGGQASKCPVSKRQTKSRPNADPDAAS